MTQAPTAARALRSGTEFGPSRVPGVARLMAYIDDLPAGATGALHFGERGMILVQSRRICWAIAHNMTGRLTDILREQSSPPVRRERVEEIYRRCRQTGTPIGEALVKSGLASERGLKKALFMHNSEAISILSSSDCYPARFVKHSTTGYDPKYSFSTAEIFVGLAAVGEAQRAQEARVELRSVLVPESMGAAFVRSSTGAGALVIAVDGGCDIAVSDLIELVNWATGLFDVAGTCDQDVFAARASWGSSASLVTWRFSDVSYLGLCGSRAAAARLMSGLSERTRRSSGVLPIGPRAGVEDR